MAHPLRTTKTTESAIALALLAAAAAALALPAATATTASDRETGTVKPVVEASAGDKKVEVIKA
ncbi:hypothetical protein [Streptomyces sp. NPDC056169]|uniref:hypothetical protein n=1 Tax=Streptomyces sp. NPDC056169 TaxID=3345734 RepID=UPI0035D68989